MVDQSAERSIAKADCSIPDNFIHFTGSTKPSEQHDSDGELALKLTTLLEVGPTCLGELLAMSMSILRMLRLLLVTLH